MKWQSIRVTGRRFVQLGATLFMLTASVGLVFPLLSEISEEFGISPTGLGLLAGVPFFTGVMAQVALAPLADRGRARQLLLSGLALVSIALIGMALADQLWEFVAARALSGVGIGIFLPAARAVVSRGEREHVGQMLGRMSGIELAGFITGPMLGSELAVRFGLDTPFLVFAAVAAVGFLVMTRLPIPALSDEALVEAKENPSSPLSSLRMLRRPPVQVAVLLGAALMLPAGLYEAVWDVYLSDLGASTRFVGLSLAAYGIPFVLTAPLGGRLADRRGGVRMALMALIGVVPLTVVYGFMTSYQLLAAFVLFEAVFNGFGMPAMQTAMVHATRPSELAAGQGLAGAAGQVAAGSAAMVSGLLYDATGPEFLFSVVAAAVAVLGFTAFAIDRRMQSVGDFSGRDLAESDPAESDPAEPEDYFLGAS